SSYSITRTSQPRSKKRSARSCCRRRAVRWRSSRRRVRRCKPDVADPRACERVALDLLARREHSRRELERKLGARGFADETIGARLDALEESGELAAARFTESFIRARVAKGHGPARIRAELAERGIDREQVAELLGAAGIDWVAVASSVRDKRFGARRPTDF